MTCPIARGGPARGPLGFFYCRFLPKRLAAFHNGAYVTLTAPRGEAQTATYGAKLVESYRNNGEMLQR
jgi:hypothetical protein